MDILFSEPGPTEEELATAIEEALSDAGEAINEQFDAWFARLSDWALAEECPVCGELAVPEPQPGGGTYYGKHLPTQAG